MSWEAMERGSGLLVLILVLEPFLLRFFLNKRGGGGRRGRNIEALDQFSQHRSDPKEQLLAFVDLSSTANGLRDQRIQTCRAFSSRTTCMIEIRSHLNFLFVSSSWKIHQMARTRTKTIVGSVLCGGSGRFENITHATDRMNQFGLKRIVHLCPQAAHDHIDYVRIGFESYVPHMFCNFIAGYYFTHGMRQVGEKEKLFGRKV